MNVLLFGATGMVGQGVLRECLLDPSVEQVRAVGRTPTGIQHPKLRETIHRDLWHYSEIEVDLSGFDACFFVLGVSSAGMKEEAYEHITYGATMAAAETLCRINPGMKFIYVSGAGTDSTERGKSMWARVKGKTENALLHCLHVSPRGYPAVARSQIQNSGLSNHLHHRETTAFVASSCLSQPCPDHSRDWASHAGGGAARLFEADSRDRGYPRRLVSLSGTGRAFPVDNRALRRNTNIR
jgi:hypothetical protein